MGGKGEDCGMKVLRDVVKDERKYPLCITFQTFTPKAGSVGGGNNRGNNGEGKKRRRSSFNVKDDGLGRVNNEDEVGEGGGSEATSCHRNS